MSNMEKITFSQGTEMISTLLKGRENGLHCPVCFWGNVGVGKTAMIEQFSKENIEVHYLNMRFIESIDLKGTIILNKKDNSPEFRQIKGCLPGAIDKKGVLFLDEISLINENMQASILGLVKDRKIPGGDYVLPENFIVLAAGNDSQDIGASFNDMSPALRDRFTYHFRVEFDPKNWLEKFILKKDKNIDKDLLMFLSNLVYTNRIDFLAPENQVDAGVSFPTPRRWEQLVDSVGDFCHLLSVDTLVSAAVGKEIALEFATFVAIKSKMPPIEKIISENIYFSEIEKTLVAISMALEYMGNDKIKSLDKYKAFDYMMQTEKREILMYFVKRLSLENRNKGLLSSVETGYLAANPGKTANDFYDYAFNNI